MTTRIRRRSYLAVDHTSARGFSCLLRRAASSLARRICWLIVSVGLVFGGAIASPIRLPSLQVERIAEIGPPRIKLTLFAPRSWKSSLVRRSMLEQAARMTVESHASCFILEDASLDRHAAYFPLRSENAVNGVGGTHEEWQRYWRLYRNGFEASGRRIGIGRPARIGEPVVLARMLIWLCPEGGPAEGIVFETRSILRKRR